MQLSEVIFQEKIWGEIKGSVLSGRWPQTSVFLGDPGFAGFLLALKVFKLHFCSNLGESYCDHCKDCQRINELSHPNMVFLIPTVGKSPVEEYIKQWRAMMIENPFVNALDWMEHLNSANSKPNINTLNIRSFIRELNTSGLESKGKMAIIWQADYLGKEGNILLKSIEEPPKNTKIILLANRRENMLTTILSRAQNFQLRPVGKSTMARVFSDSKEMGDEKMNQILDLSYGSLHEAMRLRNAEWDEAGKWFVEFLRCSFKGDPLGIKNLIEDGAKQGRNHLRNTFDFGLRYIREMLYYIHGEGEYEIRLSPPLKLSAEKLSGILDLSKLDRLRGEIERVMIGIDRNANVKMLLFDAALSIHYLLKRNI